jgi:hypothetical protein
MMTNWLATPNSVASVVVRTEGLTYFPTGDATHTLNNLRQEKVDGVTYDPGACREKCPACVAMPKVESAAQVATRWVIAKLRNRQFFSLTDFESSDP